MSTVRDVAFYVVRHGETEHNVEMRWTGRDDSHLTQRGRDDARKSGLTLKELVEDLARVDFISSPLHRACVSMEIMRGAAGLEPTRYRMDRRLMENDCGAWSSLSIHEIRARHADHHARRLDDEWNWSAPGGQSQAAQFIEVGEFLETLERDSVLVCHGLTIRLIRAHLLALTPEQALTPDLHNNGILRFSQGTEAFFAI